MREMDYLLGGFADAELPGLPEGELDNLERLLEQQSKSGNSSAGERSD